MLKKLLYTVMFLVSTIALVLMFITPIYKFDEEKINQNNTEMIATFYNHFFDNYVILILDGGKRYESFTYWY